MWEMVVENTSYTRRDSHSGGECPRAHVSLCPSSFTLQTSTPPQASAQGQNVPGTLWGRFVDCWDALLLKCAWRCREFGTSSWSTPRLVPLSFVRALKPISSN